MSTIKPALTNAASRPALMEDVLGELTSIRLRDWMGALKRWQQGALSMVHLNVVMLLKSNGPLSMSRLADLLDVSVASSTGIVDRMEKRGMVERRHSETDRRIVEVHLTQAGSGVFSIIDAERRGRLERLVGLMSDADLAALLVGLRAFRGARQQLLAELGPEADGQ
jgi:DNA-binding MarR family transcriptional regulator